jgi:hypothetical protein
MSAALSKTERKYLAQIKDKGWINVSSIDSLVWRKRQILDGLVMAGMLAKYQVSPSYDGYRMVK